MRTRRAISSGLAIATRSPTTFGRDSRQGEEWESFIVGQREGFSYTPSGGCWHREAIDSLTRSRTSYVVGQGNIFDFLWLVLC